MLTAVTQMMEERGVQRALEVHGAPLADEFTPPSPETLGELDVSAEFLADLTLKAVATEAGCTTGSVARRLHLGLLITESLLQRLYDEKLIDKKGMAGLRNYRYEVLERGWAKVDRLFKICGYVGPAPVSLATYSEMAVGQVRSRPPVRREALERAMRDLVLSEETKRTLLLVASSARSLFLSGPPGNGKTAMARALVEAIPGRLWIPYAIEVDGQVIRVFDRHHHQPVETGTSDFDHRWVNVRPPLVVAGGDLMIANLELVASDMQRFYDAPFQVKANGGVLVVDDLGRQCCSARELLNRWIIPLEYRVDYLTLNTGKKVQVPFETIVVFATNLTGGDLEDEAFLRRMGYRLTVTPPSDETYTEIFRRYARYQELPVAPRLIERFLERYRREGRIPKCCEPRDLIERVIDLCKVQGLANHLSEEALDAAWNAYFGVARQADGFAKALP